MARIGLDLDGCAYPFIEAFGKLCDFDPELVTTYDCWEQIGWTRHTWDTNLASAVDFYDIYNLEAPAPGYVDAVKTMQAAGHEVLIVTARGPRSHRRAAWMQTAEWVNDYEIPVDGVIMLDWKGGLPLDALVDDAPVHLEAFGPGAIRFERPWNAGLVGPSVRNWHDVPAAVAAMLGSR